MAHGTNNGLYAHVKVIASTGCITIPRLHFQDESARMQSFEFIPESDPHASFSITYPLPLAD